MKNRDDDDNRPQDIGSPPHDGLDERLRAWHQTNADRAAEARDKVLSAFADADPATLAEPAGENGVQRNDARGIRLSILRRLVMNRYSPVAASIVLVATLAWFLTPAGTKPAKASDVIMAPDGGRLDALDKEGNLLGPCPLKHTEVAVEVSGQFTRVTLSQLYHNPYKDKIEAVYTFPLSHRAAVDRMKMSVGDRVVIGEVHERARARAIYDAARQSGYVASLLEQERPNIFTQSVANIEPDTDVLVEISYVELLQATDGTFSFEFPMVVGPRYIPGSMPTAATNLPDKLRPRQGLILLCPSKLSIGKQGDVSRLGTLQTGKLEALLRAAIPIAATDAEWWAGDDAKPDATTEQTPTTAPAPPADNPQSAIRNSQSPTLWYQFEAAYPDGSKERGALFTDGTGQLNGRWFYADPAIIKDMGTGFAPDTTQVPDASRITPEPVRPGNRAGHDIAIRVTLDTGGPGIVDLKSALHDIIETKKVHRDDGSPRRVTLELKKEVEIPNRDFVLTWRQTADTIQEATFAHTGGHGNFFTLILQPPARVDDAQAVPRELVFVLDTSGSMSGFPIEKAKEVMTKAIGALRPTDSFNLITFSGDTRILWDKPRPGSQENIAEAQAFLAGRQGGGGTEMMKAIEAALVQTRPEGDASIHPIRICCFMTDGYVGNDMQIIDAVRKNARTTRVFSFGIGNSVNRYLLDGMARAGRGEVEYVLLQSDADEAVKRFAQRIQTPVLTDIELAFSDSLKVTDLIPKQLPDLFDVKPLIIHGRYAAAGKGTLTVRGNTGSGRYERVVPIDLPADQPEHDTIATLWARAKVEFLMNQDLGLAQSGNFPTELKQEVINLGEQFQIITQFTSFVAVEKTRVTVGGQPMLVAVPVEMPQGVSYEGVFGRLSGEATDEAVKKMAIRTLPTAKPLSQSRPADDPEYILRSNREAKYNTPVAPSAPASAPVIASPLDSLILAQSAGTKAKVRGPVSAAEYGLPSVPAGEVLYSTGSSWDRGASSDRSSGGVELYYDGTGNASGGMKGGRHGFRRGSAGGWFDHAFDADGDGVMHKVVEAARQLEDAQSADGRLAITFGYKAGTVVITEDFRQVEDLPRLMSALDRPLASVEPLASPLLRERVALGIAELFADGKTDDAKKLADQLVGLDANYKLGVQMRDTLADARLAPAERDARIRALGMEARKAIETFLRDARLRHRLDARLYRYFTAGASTTKPADLTLVDGSVMVKLLATRIDDATIDAIKDAGLNVEATVESVNLVVGLAPRDRLADIALLDGVRKVEPVEQP